MVETLEWQNRILAAATASGSKRQTAQDLALAKALALYGPSIELAKAMKGDVESLPGNSVTVSDIKRQNGGLVDGSIRLSRSDGQSTKIEFRLGAHDLDRLIIHGIGATVAPGFFPPGVDKPQYTAQQILDAVGQTIELFYQY